MAYVPSPYGKGLEKYDLKGIFQPHHSDSQKFRLIKSEAVSQHSRTKMFYTFINGRLNSWSIVDTETLSKEVNIQADAP